MRASAGDPGFPIWLVADSQPKNWHRLLATPLDPRHPARHNIWTSVLDYMQEALYRKEKRRFGTASLYIRNAVTNPDDKPDAVRPDWSPKLQEEIDALKASLLRFKPRIVLTFGAFAFEFLRRAWGEEPSPFAHWGTKQLGVEFRERVKAFDPSGTNILPLLHVSISRGKFLESHRYFVGEEAGGEVANYFEFVGAKLAELLLQQLALDPIWIQ